MPRVFCTGDGCTKVFDKQLTGTTKCPDCQAKAGEAKNAANREYDRTRRKPRGSATARGYGAPYQRASRALRRETTCHWCQLPFTEQDPLTIDHIVALAQGGTNDPANLCAAHRSCNSRRGGQLRRTSR